MRRAITFLRLFWRNYRFFHSVAFKMAVEDAAGGLDSKALLSPEQATDEMTYEAVEMAVRPDPFGSFKRLNMEINDAR